MKSKVLWSAQVEGYVRSKAPEPRGHLWRGLKRLADWDGKEDPPRIKFLEDDLIGYIRLRVGGHRIIFREAFSKGIRTLNCLYAGPRSTVYEAFQELFLDALASKHLPEEPSA